MVINTGRTMDVPEVAKTLGISSYSAYEQAKTVGSIAGIPIIRIGRRIVVSREAVENLLGGKPESDMTATLEDRINRLEREQEDLKRLLRDIARQIERAV